MTLDRREGRRRDRRRVQRHRSDRGARRVGDRHHAERPDGALPRHHHDQREGPGDRRGRPGHRPSRRSTPPGFSPLANFTVPTVNGHAAYQIVSALGDLVRRMDAVGRRQQRGGGSRPQGCVSDAPGQAPVHRDRRCQRPGRAGRAPTAHGDRGSARGRRRGPAGGDAGRAPRSRRRPRRRSPTRSRRRSRRRSRSPWWPRPAADVRAAPRPVRGGRRASAGAGRAPRPPRRLAPRLAAARGDRRRGALRLWDLNALGYNTDEAVYGGQGAAPCPRPDAVAVLPDVPRASAAVPDAARRSATTRDRRDLRPPCLGRARRHHDPRRRPGRARLYGRRAALLAAL